MPKSYRNIHSELFLLLLPRSTGAHHISVTCTWSLAIFVCLSHKFRITVNAMCTSYYIQYTRGCRKEMEFVQCDGRQGSNVKCKPIKKELGKNSTNYCKGHLVNPDAPKKYFSDEDLQE
ncbi:uncharacterized protein AKAW2_50353A [Aspergillus luchuensis]|uniref:Uncharacterized protein n=1 Tax=Aspergillus kawachii TaxID=1069201 RepID=A0A7R8A060_ASPKA|nr:uncharacterized protein AKAW2_50353A [Aspergillus luchuensis]BCS00012.1 hypothetical protein AKAW2_50353A [Aspergillus luchuensis]